MVGDGFPVPAVRRRKAEMHFGGAVTGSVGDGRPVLCIVNGGSSRIGCAARMAEGSGKAGNPSLGIGRWDLWKSIQKDSI